MNQSSSNMNQSSSNINQGLATGNRNSVEPNMIPMGPLQLAPAVPYAHGQQRLPQSNCMVGHWYRPWAGTPHLPPGIRVSGPHMQHIQHLQPIAPIAPIPNHLIASHGPSMTPRHPVAVPSMVVDPRQTEPRRSHVMVPHDPSVPSKPSLPSKPSILSVSNHPMETETQETSSPLKESTCNDDFGDFTPVQGDIINLVRTAAARWEREGRNVTFFRDKSFESLCLEMIIKKFEPFLGHIENGCVFIYREKSNDRPNHFKVTNALIVHQKKQEFGPSLQKRGVVHGDYMFDNITSNPEQFLVAKIAYYKSSNSSHKRPSEDNRDEINQGKRIRLEHPDVICDCDVFDIS